MNNSVIKIENITKEFKTGETAVQALKGVSFELEQGEMLAIMGSSGSGKSTMLNIIGTLEEPDSGKIYLNGEYVEDYSTEPKATQIRNEHIGFVFQNFNLLNDLTVRENIALPLTLQRKNEKEAKSLVEDVISLVGLSEKIDSGILELSGGQQQRVAIARAIISNPNLILADEPTGNLDYNTSIEIMKLFKDLQETSHQSIIIVTHDPMVAAYAQRVIFFHDGMKKAEYVNEQKKDDFTEILNIFRRMSLESEEV